MFQWNCTHGLRHLNFTFSHKSGTKHLLFTGFMSSTQQYKKHSQRLPLWLSNKEFTCQCRRHRFPDPGRSHMPRSTQACVPHLLSLHSRARELQLLTPACLRAHAPQQEIASYRGAHITATRVASTRHNSRKACTATKTSRAKINISNKTSLKRKKKKKSILS